MCGMTTARTQKGSDATNRVSAVGLEASAGLALACAYSSSDEYEAEVIQGRRKAGAYALRHNGRLIGVLAVAAALVIAAVFAV